MVEPASPVTATTAPANFALIIGAMKSGTTTLFEVLAQHPAIAASSIKEPRFFSEPDVWARGWDWYVRLWDWDARRHRVALEASAAYTTAPARPGVPGRIAAVRDARFRFIYIMRHPVPQIESNVRHTLYAGWGRSLDEGIPEWMIETVQYAMQLDQYAAVFPRDAMLPLTLEEYHRDPEGVLARICRFLEVDDTFAFRGATTRYNEGAAYEVPGLVARVVTFGPVRWLAGHLIPRGVRHRIRAVLPRLAGRRRSLGRYRLTEAEQAAVVTRLLPDLRRLESEYGVPVRRDWGIAIGARAD